LMAGEPVDESLLLIGPVSDGGASN
jgi:hypothetical protein